MRIAIAEFKQETNTFVPRPTTFDDFVAWHFWTGDQVIAGSRNTNCEVAGFLDVLEAQPAGSVEIVPLLATFAMSGGRVTRATYERILADLLARLRAAGPLDGVLLALHGAMVMDGDDDPDGNTIAAVRAAIGDTPFVVTFDLHANITWKMASHCDALVGFKTSPHIDLRDTGQRGARVLMRMLNEGARPVTAFVKIPMNVPASTHIHHLPGPFMRLQEHTKVLETNPAILTANMITVQPWLDIAEMGFATLVTTDADPALAASAASDLADRAWSERHAFMETHLVPPAEAIARALAAPAGPVVLSDLADGTGAGSPGDATAVIRALLVADPPLPAYVCVKDPAAAHEAIAAGVGATVDLEVGAKLDTIFNTPVRLRGEVEFAGPARFRFAGGGYTGVEMDMGDCAVIRCGNVHVLVLGIAVMTVDPAMYRAVGLEPADARIVVVKSHIQFRAGYGDIAKEIILLDSPGMSSDHLESLPWRVIPRPMFPLDADTTFTAAPRLHGRGA